MKRIKEMILFLKKGVSRAVLRFPLTVLCLLGATVTICYMISLRSMPPVIVEKLTFTFMVGAILGMAAQFALERFHASSKKRFAAYVASVLLTAGYFLILWPAPEISAQIGIRTFVTVFSMVCAVLWFPSYRGKTDFNKVALIHFKSLFTSILYAAVLSGGIAAIIGAIDVLLFDVNSDTYSYMMAIIWVMFATVYYLSLLPKFGSDDEFDVELMQRAEKYPKFLEILVSYIAIPLVAMYTAVLFVYFIKILVTFHWPSGQLGPMVLGYSAAGLIVLVLSGILNNKFADFYKMLFPKVLIPVVVMQLISVGIRLNAYGITESRYYVVLFGIFSILMGILLSRRNRFKYSVIALFAAIFAVFSVVPPFDAFAVSRSSQIGRVESILEAEGMLKDGVLTPKADASDNTRIEMTNILYYLDRQGSLQYIEWLPEDFEVYTDMKDVFGFEPLYPDYYGDGNRYFYVSLDTRSPVGIEDYNMFVTIFSDRYSKDQNDPIKFTAKGESYTLFVERVSNEEARISVKNAQGIEVISTGLYDFARGLKSENSAPKDVMPADKMSFEVTRDGYKLKVLLQNVNITEGETGDSGVDYSAIIFFGAP